MKLHNLLEKIKKLQVMTLTFGQCTMVTQRLSRHLISGLVMAEIHLMSQISLNQSAKMILI